MDLMGLGHFHHGEKILQGSARGHGAARRQDLDAAGDRIFTHGLDRVRVLHKKGNRGVHPAHQDRVRSAFFPGTLRIGLGLKAQDVGPGLTHPFHNEIHIATDMKDLGY